MRDRYKRFLKYLEREDFDNILRYLKDFGMVGSLIFKKIENVKILESIGSMKLTANK